MNIVLFGASGFIGQRIVLEALVRGHEIKAITREPASYPIAHPRLTVASANILDASSVAEAATGYDVLINATGSKKIGMMDIYDFFVDSTQAVIEGARRAGVQRLITVGGAGSLEVAPGVVLADTPEFPAAVYPIANGQRASLAVYRATTDVNWTFFCPSARIEPGRRTGAIRLGTDHLLTNDQGESYISAEDYAFALLNEIEQPQFEGKRFTAVSLEKP
jgi:putative NADH-flavin reductase